MRYGLAVAAMTGLILASCAGKVDYIPPSSARMQTNTRTINEPRDTVWNRIIPALSKEFFVINTIDRQSGLINLSYSGNPEKYIDCGRISSYVKNARGERTYNFTAADAHQIYEVMAKRNLFFIDRTMKLDGRVNLILESIGKNSTQITATARYIVSRSVHISNPNGQGETLNDVINFNSGGEASFPSKGGPFATSCRANGNLEADILRTAG